MGVGVKANEFVQKKGWNETKDYLRLHGWKNTSFLISLKRLVVSKDLVESYGGLDEAKKYVDDLPLSCGLMKISIREAIKDVEECKS